MSYLSQEELRQYGFKKLGNNLRISSKASIYNPELISIGDNTRIDDFCVVSGLVELGKYVHLTPMCLVAGGEPGVFFGDFSTCAYGVKVFAQSDDYSGETMCNSLIPRKFKREIFCSTRVGRQVIIGAGTTILPGAHIAEGCAVGAMSLLLSPTEEWGIYAGAPARRIKERSRKLLELEAAFLKEVNA